jgi:hypothetical protein
MAALLPHPPRRLAKASVIIFARTQAKAELWLQVYLTLSLGNAGNYRGKS